MRKLHGSDCSLVVATYNWPAALNVCLQSIKTQSTLPGEVIVADDGSNEQTRELIDEMRKDFPVKLVHIWQPDEGFQLAKIRNRAFAAAKHSYIIQADGDLILHRHFIKDHLSLAKQSSFITGSRTLLKEEATTSILQGDTTNNRSYIMKGKGSNFFNGLRIGFLRRFLARRYKMEGKNKYYVKGCNMSFWRKDIIAVNGYNEAFTGWGKEDSELAIRLINAGIKKQFIKTGGICYHLYHKEASRELELKNTEMMNNAIKNKIIWAAKGIDQYLQA